MSWEVGQLSDIAEVISGYAFKSEWFGKGKDKIIRIGDLQQGRINDTDIVTFNADEQNVSQQFRIKKGDVLMALSGATVGKIAVAEEKDEGAFLNQRVAIIRSRNSESSGYLKYIFNKVTMNKLLASAGGAAQPNLSPKKLSSTEILLPSLEEQNRIAAILDKADSIRRKRQKAIEMTDQLLKSVFLDMFGDPVINPNEYPVHSLGELCEDLFLGLTSKVDYVSDNSGFPLVRAKDINTGELVLDEVRYISEKQHKKLTKNHLTKKGDLLVSKSGTLGTCAIVKEDVEFSTYESIFTVRPDKEVLNIHFLIHLIRSDAFNKKLLGNKVGGTVSHLNLKMFRDFQTPVPPIEIQNKFSEIVSKIENKRLNIKDSLKISNILFEALSQKAFRGELINQIKAA